MCLFHMHFLKENALRSFFSQNGFPPRCHMMLPLRAHATVTHMGFLHAGAMENLTYTRDSNSPDLCTVIQGAPEQSF